MKQMSYLDMVKTLLPTEEFLEFEKYYTKPVRKSIKILNVNKEQTRQRLEQEGRILTPPNFSWKGKTYDDVLFVEKADKQSLGSHPLHAEGGFYVQEMSAGLPAQMLNIQQGDLVLDMCAAPGGKSVQLADKLLNKESSLPHPTDRPDGSKTDDQAFTKRGCIISNELNPARRKALEANLERCGIWNEVITGYDGKILGKLLHEQCDKVLLDAPCSGEGMQYKSDFKVYRWDEKHSKKIAQTQKELLLSGLEALKIWGELVYSTCTTNVLENEGVIASVLEEVRGCVELLNVEIEEKSKGISTVKGIADNVARFWPHLHHTGGFFIAKFRKISKLPETTVSPRNTLVTRLSEENADPFMVVPAEKIAEWLKKEGMKEMRKEEDGIFLQTKHTVRLASKNFLEIKNTVFVQRAGLPIFKVLPDGKRKVLPGLEKVFGI